MNDLMDEEHERERTRLGLSSDEYWYRLAVEKVGTEDEQIADILAQLRSSSYENKVRADTLERRLNRWRSIGGWDMRRKINDYMSGHPGVSRKDARAAVLRQG